MDRRFWGTQPLQAVSEAVNSLDQFDWSAPTPPTVWMYTPPMVNNPYQAMLYSRMMDHNIMPVPVAHLEHALELRENLPQQVRAALHIHWTHLVMHKFPNPDQARKQLETFLRQVESVKAAGVPLMWTVHNELPHDARHEALEAELQTRLLAMADRVHIMSSLTPELCKSWFSVESERILQVPHPSYQGVYPDWIPRATARRQLGIRDGELVFLMFGSIKPYKGLTEAIAAINEFAQERAVRLIVAGSASQTRETTEFLDAALANPVVIVRPELIHVNDVQVYYRASDIALLPYRRTLNSGALALALTFGLPAIMPSDSGSLPLLEPTFSEVFDSSQPEALVEALRRSVRLANPEARAAASAAADKVRLTDVAHDFATHCQEWLSRSES